MFYFSDLISFVILFNVFYICKNILFLFNIWYLPSSCSKIVRDNTYCLSVSFNKLGINPVSSLRWDVSTRASCQNFHRPQQARILAYLFSVFFCFFFSRVSDWVSLCPKSESLTIRAGQRMSFNKLGIQPVLTTERRCDTKSRFLWGTRAFQLGPMVKIYPATAFARLGEFR